MQQGHQRLSAGEEGQQVRGKGGRLLPPREAQRTLEASQTVSGHELTLSPGAQRGRQIFTIMQRAPLSPSCSWRCSIPLITKLSAVKSECTSLTGPRADLSLAGSVCTSRSDWRLTKLNAKA